MDHIQALVEASPKYQNICLKYRNETSLNEVEFSELKSALQKYIRRNELYAAVWCAVEWFAFSYGYGTDINKKRIRTNLINRILICYLEDVGLGNLNLWLQIDAMLDVKLKTLTLPNLVSIVSKLAQSQGCRLISFTVSMYKIMKNKPLLEKQLQYLDRFPVVKDVYDTIESNKFADETKMFKQMLKEKHLAVFYYAKKISNRMVQDKKGKWIAKPKYGKNNPIFPILKTYYRKHNLDLKWVRLAEKWYNAIHNSEAFLAYFIPILMVLFDFNLDGSIGSEEVDAKTQLLVNINHPALKIHDYCIDMHTKRGRQNGFQKNSLAGVTEWVTNGTQIDHEFEPRNKKRYKELKAYYFFSKYLSVDATDQALSFLPPLSGNKRPLDTNEEKKASKREKLEEDPIEDFMEDEKEERIMNEESYIFTFLCRAHVTTSSAKWDGYFARMNIDFGDFREGDIVFVKGPIANPRLPALIDYYYQIKLKLGLPCIANSHMEMKVADAASFFGETKNPFLRKSNYRYKMEPIECAEFIIYKNLFEDVLPTQTYGDESKHSSKPWKDAGATILDFKELARASDGKFKCFDSKTDLVDATIRSDYILAMCFRYLFGIKDHADRNFVVSNGNLYSVDEENIDMLNEIKYGKKHAKKKKYILDHFDIIPPFSQWKIKLASMKKLTEQTHGRFTHRKLMKRIDALIANPKLVFQL